MAHRATSIRGWSAGKSKPMSVTARCVIATKFRIWPASLGFERFATHEPLNFWSM